MLLFLRRNLGFTVAVAIHVIATAIWSATLPHPTRTPGVVAWSVVLISGFLVGAVDEPPYVRRVITLGVVLALFNGIIHWLTALAGKDIDLGTPAGSIVIACVSMPLSIGLSIIGGLIGRSLRAAYGGKTKSMYEKMKTK